MPLTFAFSLVTPVRSSSSSSECAQYSIRTRAGQRSLERWELTRSWLHISGAIQDYEFLIAKMLRICDASDLNKSRYQASQYTCRPHSEKFGRLFGAVGGITPLFPTPEVLANADLESIGLPRVKADAIRALARVVRDGQISLKKLQTRVLLLTRLYEIPGIRRCAAQWVRETGREGVVFLLNLTSVEEAHSFLAKLRLGQTGLMEFDLMPLGPLNPLRLLLSKQP
jgi:hypothetical protein